MYLLASERMPATKLLQRSTMFLSYSSSEIASNITVSSAPSCASGIISRSISLSFSISKASEDLFKIQRRSSTSGNKPPKALTADSSIAAVSLLSRSVMTAIFSKAPAWMIGFSRDWWKKPVKLSFPPTPQISR